VVRYGMTQLYCIADGHVCSSHRQMLRDAPCMMTAPCLFWVGLRNTLPCYNTRQKRDVRARPV